VSPSLPVLVTARAASAIAEAGEWWVANRPKAPGAFAEELEKSLALISSQPTIGARSLNATLPGVRRIHLARIHYHLYYRVAGTPPAVQVLALWHASRGPNPNL
jgi:plasmid stabilization system protein ParE